jgi:hypothetical protein
MEKVDKYKIFEENFEKKWIQIEIKMTIRVLNLKANLK